MPALSNLSSRRNKLRTRADLRPRPWPVLGRAAAVLLAALGVDGPCFGQAGWKTAYFHDEDRSRLALIDFVFPSAQSGIAIGVLQGPRGDGGAILRTGDGGKSWKLEKIRGAPRSLFFLDERTGWMVKDDGLWKTEDGGAAFRRVLKHDGLLRLHFADAARGWAAGAKKAVLETSDGGRNWVALPAAAEPSAEPDRCFYNWVTFANPRFGIIVGHYVPSGGDEDERLPEWMDPPAWQFERQRPAAMFTLQTLDGGKTWKSSTTSAFGRMTRLRLLPDGVGLSLIEFTRQFEYPSEVYRVRLAKGETTRVFRQANRKVTDVWVDKAGTAFLAAVEPQGTTRTLPVPGRLHVLRSVDLSSWEDMQVDYRAVAQRAVFAGRPGGELWLATSEGMLLRLPPGVP